MDEIDSILSEAFFVCNTISPEKKEVEVNMDKLRHIFSYYSNANTYENEDDTYKKADKKFYNSLKNI